MLRFSLACIFAFVITACSPNEVKTETGDTKATQKIAATKGTLHHKIDVTITPSTLGRNTAVFRRGFRG